MSADEPALSGPDLAAGVPLTSIPDGELFLGHALGKPVIVVRRGAAVLAIGAQCTHYGGALAHGLLVGDTVRCPLHHACFSLRTGEALRAPALNPVATWTVGQRGESVFVTGEVEPADGATPPPVRASVPTAPSAIVIVGGGAAGNAAAEMLRRLGYRGPVTMISADDDGPYDRPNLSKDYLAGNAPEEWIPLRPASFYADHAIELIAGARATAIDAAAKRVVLADGRQVPYDRLLLATGAEPVRLTIPGAELAHVRYLRTLGDSRAIVARAKTARRAVVIGASFIGLEVAGALRTRGLEVHVVAPDTVPLAKIMGPDIGASIRALHESHGVTFHLGATATAIDGAAVTLAGGERIDADLVVVGIGVRPALALAESAGVAVDRGVTVDAYLESSVPGIFAAGDIARWPDVRSGTSIRVEHWVVAERQGQAAARNILGRRERFDAVPFFWSAHYDRTICYVGHAESWDTAVVDGDTAAGDATVTLQSRGATAAVLTIGRDGTSLRAERALELEIHKALSRS